MALDPAPIIPPPDPVEVCLGLRIGRKDAVERIDESATQGRVQGWITAQGCEDHASGDIQFEPVRLACRTEDEFGIVRSVFPESGRERCPLAQYWMRVSTCGVPRQSCAHP